MFYGKAAPGFHEALSRSIGTLQELFERVYAQDNLIAIRRNLGFLNDAKFRRAFDQFAKSDLGRSLAWRLHTLTWAADHCLTIPGDFVECGVSHGFSMAVVAAYVEFENISKTMYLYDTFESQNDPSMASGGDASQRPLVEEVRDRFAKYSNVKIIPGTVPESFAQACPECIAFLHLDMNSAKSEVAALESLFERVAPGGMIVFDDYGWFDYVPQHIATNAFMNAHGHRVVELPTGQGLLIKK